DANSNRPIRVLLVPAYTYGETSLNPDDDPVVYHEDTVAPASMVREVETVQRILDDDEGKRFRSTVLEGRVTRKALRRALQIGDVDLLHFTGHGYHCAEKPDESCVILWEDEQSDELR